MSERVERKGKTEEKREEKKNTNYILILNFAFPYKKMKKAYLSSFTKAFYGVKHFKNLILQACM